MVKNRWVIAILILLFSSLACNFVLGSVRVTPTSSIGYAQPTVEKPIIESPTVEAAESTPSSNPPSGQDNGETKKFQTEFPLPADVSNFTELGFGAVNFQTKMNLKDALAFYRDAFVKNGYKEREINTSISDSTFSLVFDGHSSGKEIVIQAVDLGNGSTNINIRFEAN
jgi:hypothetical protein